jgi:NADH-quinone oxidoreductase subunit C
MTTLSSTYLSKTFLDNLIKVFPPILVSTVNGERIIKTTSYDLIPLLCFLKQHTGTQFSQLIDITAIDWPERKNRFEIVYSLLSISTARRLSVSVIVSEGDAVSSVTSLYSSAGWYEREVFDIFGIPFTGHPDLRPRLSDYGFQGSPLRKDFPLTGYYTEVRYSELHKRIVIEPVSLAQEFRQFTLETP